MKCVVVCQDDLVIRTLHEALAPAVDASFIVEDRPLARRLADAGVPAVGADPRRLATFVNADVGPTTCVIVHDPGRRGLRQVLRAAADAGTGLLYVLAAAGPAANWSAEFPEVARLTLSDLVRGALHDSLGRALTRARVQQYQRYFADADRVLILLHNDPDPDAMASGLALRSLLHRTRTTAIIGAFRGVTRPENQRMANLLDIRVEALTAESLAEFDRIATVDVQPHYFGGLLNRVDLVVDHHPERRGYTTTFKDIRPDFGSTATILTEHLRAVDVNISERTATAMLYAIKSDTLFLSRHINRQDLEAFTFLYPLADAALVRKMEGSEITIERLQSVARAVRTSRLEEQVFAAHVGPAAREDLVPYVADFLLQLEDVKWSIVAGEVEAHLIVCVRNLGYSRNAGDFVRRWFSDIGSAGGHRAMAKAVVPMTAFEEKFGALEAPQIAALLGDLGARFLRER